MNKAEYIRRLAQLIAGNLELLEGMKDKDCAEYDNIECAVNCLALNLQFQIELLIK